MKLEFTKTQLLALSDKLLEAIEQYDQLKEDKMTTHVDSLIKSCLEEMWTKVEKKLIDHQLKYTINITPSQGFAILVQWQGMPHDASHAGNLVHQLCNKIDQQYA